MKPETTSGTAQGNIAKDLKILDPLVIRDKQCARSRLKTKVKSVVPPQKTRVFLKLNQKTR